MDFGEALNKLKNGEIMSRSGWTGRGMFVVYRHGYSDGVFCNKQMSEDWGIKEDTVCVIEPYFQLQLSNGNFTVWVPNTNDLLANDWICIPKWGKI